MEGEVGVTLRSRRRPLTRPPLPIALRLAAEGSPGSPRARTPPPAPGTVCVRVCSAALMFERELPLTVCPLCHGPAHSA